MGGPVYRYDANSTSDVKFPAEYDGDFFAGEFGRRWIKRIETGGDGTVQSINAFPWTGTQVMDMAFGPDGALYVLDYGTGYFNGDANSALYRIEHITGGRAPLAQAKANTTSGEAPLNVDLLLGGQLRPGRGRVAYAWTFGDGATSTAANPSRAYTANGQYTATLKVTDPTGKSATASVQITVGNAAPTVRLDAAADGRIYDFGAATEGGRDTQPVSWPPISSAALWLDRRPCLLADGEPHQGVLSTCLILPVSLITSSFQLSAFTAFASSGPSWLSRLGQMSATCWLLPPVASYTLKLMLRAFWKELPFL
ncbi:hypothetical protein SALBM217S_05216 [Streptomyces griseoloalbus]